MPYVRRTVSTSQMTDVELAAVWAEHYGWKGLDGGWIADDLGIPVVQGWADLTRWLTDLGFIEVGKGVMWRATEQRWPWLRPDRQQDRLRRWRELSPEQRARLEERWLQDRREWRRVNARAYYQASRLERIGRPKPIPPYHPALASAPVRPRQVVAAQ
jgi:hypothetical protein